MRELRASVAAPHEHPPLMDWAAVLAIIVSSFAAGYIWARSG